MIEAGLGDAEAEGEDDVGAVWKNEGDGGVSG